LLQVSIDKIRDRTFYLSLPHLAICIADLSGLVAKGS